MRLVDVSILLNENAYMNKTLGTFGLPEKRYFTIPIEDFGRVNGDCVGVQHVTHGLFVEINAMEIRPPDFDESRKYGVLFRMYVVLIDGWAMFIMRVDRYAGPNSQQVSHKAHYDWSTYIASNYDMIVLVMDGRGTGFKGERFLKSVYRHLGDYEVQDILSAAE